MKTTFLVIALLFNSTLIADTDVPLEVRVDETHSHPLPDVVEGEIVTENESSLETLNQNTLQQLDCVIESELGEEIELGQKVNATVISRDEQGNNSSYLIARMLRLRNGDLLGSLEVSALNSDMGVQAYAIPKNVAATYEFNQQIGKQISPTVNYEGETFKLKCKKN